MADDDLCGSRGGARDHVVQVNDHVNRQIVGVRNVEWILTASQFAFMRKFDAVTYALSQDTKICFPLPFFQALSGFFSLSYSFSSVAN